LEKDEWHTNLLTQKMLMAQGLFLLRLFSYQFNSLISTRNGELNIVKSQEQLSLHLVSFGVALNTRFKAQIHYTSFFSSVPP